MVPLPIRRTTSKCSKTTVSPSQSCQDAVATGSRVTMLLLLPPTLKHMTPMPPVTRTQAINPNAPKCMAPVDKIPRIQQQMPQKKVIPKPVTTGSASSRNIASSSQAVDSNSGWGSPAWTSFSLTDISPLSPTGFGISFPPDPTSPLHRKPGTFRFGPPVPTTGSEAFTQPSSSQLLMVDGTFFLTDYSMSC